MLGSWSRTTSEGSTATESWVDVGHGVFRGAGPATVPGSETSRLVETLLLVEMSGEIFYLAKVDENERPVSFRLVAVSAGRAVFQNPDHDVPQRLDYRLDEEGRLNVDVRGGERGFSVIFSPAREARTA
jgi:hypothetical protein